MRKKALIYVILSGILWGTSGIFVHYLTPMGLSAMQMTAIRGFVSAVILSVYALLKKRELFKTNLKEFVLYALSGMAMFLTSACYYAAIQKTSVSTAEVLMYTAPIIVMIYSVIFFGEKITPLKAAAVACMLVGCALISGIVGGLKFDVLGIILGYGSGIAYSSYNIVTKTLMKQKSDPLRANLYCFIFMSFFALIASKPWHIAEVAVGEPCSVPFMLGCGLCTGALPYFLYTLALKTLPAGTASSLGVIEPMAATLFSVTLLGEVLSIYSILGIALMLVAIFILGKTSEE